MNTLECRECKKVKDVADFSKMYQKRPVDQYHRCKVCDREYYSRWDRQHPGKRKKYTTKFRHRIRDSVRELKENTPCADCGRKYPYHIMHFDHLESSTKKTEIGRLVGTGLVTALTEEMKKCELVCSNCHGIRTFNRRAKKA